MFVFSNLAISLDGKISTKNKFIFHLGSSHDRKLMAKIRKEADAIMVGSSTMRTYKKPFVVKNKKGKNPINVFITSKLEGISASWAFFKKKDIRRIVFVTQPVSSTKLKQIGQHAEIIRISSRSRPAAQIVKELSKRGVRNLLIEGGGELMWTFVKERKLQELNVTVTPKLIGGNTTPTLLGGEGFSENQIRNLRLIKISRKKDELFLKYRVRS